MTDAEKVRKLEADVAALEAELQWMRDAMVRLFPPQEGFTEAFDTLIDLELLVEVPADEDFKMEWGDDEETMYVFKWVADQ